MTPILLMLLPSTLGFLNNIGGGGHKLKEYASSKTCARVKPHSSGYLHFLMENCKSISDVRSIYSKKSNSSLASSIYPSFLPSLHASRTDLSDDQRGFQSPQQQDVADQCVQVSSCDQKARYRTFNGECNNDNFPMWGMAGSAMVRLLPAKYHDGVSEVRKDHRGKELHNARQIRTHLFPDKIDSDQLNMLCVMQWGQLVAHDTAHIVQQDSEVSGIDCCSGQPQTLPSACFPIQVPQDDEFYSQYKQTCLNFVRATTTDNFGCKLSPQQQIATVTHFLDASFVYGSSHNTANSLRTFVKGKLRVQLTSDKREFPPNSKNVANDCDNEGSDNICYFAGDDRANQNTGMTLLQVVFLREHNRLCEELSVLNPHWNDETLYQESRRLVGAIIQRITYAEFLLIIIGKEFLKKLNLEDGNGSDELSKNYDPFLNPSTLNSFAAAAYRSFHSMITEDMVLFDENLQQVETLKIDNFYFRPTIIQKPGMLDKFLLGLALQPSQKMDPYFTTAITNKLFKSEKEYGTDLESIDIQRGRDHGLATYCDFRAACGLSEVKDFKDLSGIMPEEAITKLSSLFERVTDIDLYIGGMLENHAPGALLGPTFQCIVGEQFKRWRNGDKYYYEHGDQPGSFSLEQVIEIRKVTLAKILCLNGDNITRIQPDVFRVQSDQNRVQLCESIDGMSLSPWKEEK